MRSVRWDGGDIVAIDQTKLPFSEEWIRLSTTEQVAEAIQRLRVRGAPVLGIVGAMGIAQAAFRWDPDADGELMVHLENVGRTLRQTRPTAVNLAWGIDRMLSCARTVADAGDIAHTRATLQREALAIQDEDARACDEMARHALEFFRERSVVMTHCNTGFLCTGGTGTALGAIRLAHDRGLGIAVMHTETRPLLQGSRLTAWELKRFGVPGTVVVDSAAPGLIARGDVGLVIVGADRIAANGDVANKVGTYSLALAASAANVPFVVVAPTTSVDLGTPDGRHIEVEERDADEVTSVLGVGITSDGVAARNPAFDVTPNALVTAIVTERGVARAPYGSSLAALIDPSARAS